MEDDDEDFGFDFNDDLTPEEKEEIDRKMREEEKMRKNHPMTKQGEEILPNSNRAYRKH